MNNNKPVIAATLPAIPAAINKNHKPTLQFTMNVELQEKRNAGRYCIVNTSVNE